MNLNAFPYEAWKAALSAEVTVAFDGVSRENGVSLSESWVIDDYGSNAERAEARRQDTETRWQDVPEADISRGYSCLNFLDEIGFRYYIPAYLVWFLRYIDDDSPESPLFSSNTFESLIYALGGTSGELPDFKLAQFQSLIPPQSRAIAHFLEFDAQRQDEAELEAEKWRQQHLAKAGYSQAEIDALWHKAEQFRIEKGLPKNDARHALERHWGQFLRDER